MWKMFHINMLKLITLWGSAWLIWGVGLIAPLTPSEGVPTVGNLLIFMIFPQLISAIGCYLARGYKKLWFAAQIIIIVLFSGYLLILQKPM